MNTNKTYFQLQDFYDQPPEPGYYTSTISSARFRKSSKGNRMLQIVHSLQDVFFSHQKLADYFVLEGEQVSPTGILIARRRLVQLYHACGLYPKDGNAIDPSELLHTRLQVRVEHEDWEEQLRLRVVAYRPLQSLESEEDEEIPF